MTISIERVKAILSEFAKQKILVVGDLMLDRYIYGSVSRISPEAPVPVVHVTGEKSMPGGAANAAWNLTSLGSKAVVNGVLGRDHAGEELKAILAQSGVTVAGSLETGELPTIVKTRIIAERQQVVRVDWEGTGELDETQMNAFCESLTQSVSDCTGVILEDYGKGMIQPPVVEAVLKAAASAKVPVGFDPKDNHEFIVKGVTIATPNRKEAFTIAGVKEAPAQANPLEDKQLLKAVDILRGKWEPELLLVTLGSHGMLLAGADGTLKHVPNRAREVFDVSGAGDTVIATCVLALSAGATPYEAAELANYAAGVVVGKLGTASCTQDELIRYME